MMMKNNSERAGIYVHIPFCVRKCIYCDFVSFPGCREDTIRKYFSALEQECGLLNRFFPPDRAGSQLLPADTLFIGGGTPSTVHPAYIERLVSCLPVAEDAEITMEANPGTLSTENLQAYRACGINRLSLGVQSFHDGELVFLGRVHSREQALSAFREARLAGFDNLSLDLMFGFPGQTMASWRETLETAVRLEPDHLSFYSLQIEEGTPLYRMFREDRVEQIPDELNREMYHYAVGFLRENGYSRYEVSNAARPGRECRHNIKYWTMAPYFGLGIGAHSFVQDIRYANPDNMEDYTRMISRLARPDSFFTERGGLCHRNTIEDSMSDYMFTGLRLTEGVRIRDFEKRFGVDFRKHYQEALTRRIQDGTMILEGDSLRFTEKGIDLSNYILMDFI